MSANQLNAGGQSLLSGVDFYRRVPKDLTEATSLGASMSIVAFGIMGILFLSETLAFARTTLTTAIEMDSNTDAAIRINFNITLLDMHCDYLVIDVLDALGTNRQNVTKNVDKWQLDEDGNRRIYAGRNREMREVRHEEHEQSLEEMHEDGVHVEVLTSDSIKGYLEEHEVAFINFFAPWCVWCQRLHPTWEKLAEKVSEEGMPLGVANVDCVAQNKVCQEYRVMAFPTLRWFHKSEAIMPDYKMDRTVSALYNYAKRKLDLDPKLREWDKNKPNTESKIDPKKEEQRRRAATGIKSREEHPGCQLSGHLMVNRVPGNFHVMARSKVHNINPTMANLTHRINHLSFGEPMYDMKSGGRQTSVNRKSKRIIKQVPEEHRQFTPLDDQLFFNREYHQAHHHYIKVVSTHLLMGGRDTTDDYNTLVAYQFLEQSQIVYYEEVDVPEARFSYDISPMSVLVKKEGRKWYDYLTSLCAIIGGTFTTLGMIDASLYKVFKSKKVD